MCRDSHLVIGPRRAASTTSTIEATVSIERAVVAVAGLIGVLCRARDVPDRIWLARLRFLSAVNTAPMPARAWGLMCARGGREAAGLLLFA